MTDAADVLTNFCTALYSKFTAVDIGGSQNAFYTAINGQMFEDEAPQGTQYPYATYSIIDAPKERTFTEIYTNISLEISIFSANMDSSEIKNLYQKASALFNECGLTITGSTLVWLRETNVTSVVEEITTMPGTDRIRTYHIEFEAKTSLQ
jgi:hypothetical protein